MLLLGKTGLAFPPGVVWAVVLSAVGFGLVWSHTDEEDRTRSLLWRAAAGGVLLVVGLGVLFASGGVLGTIGTVGLVVLATGLGVALLLGPWILSLWRDLASERRERIRSEERSEIAAHLHDLGKIGVPDQILHKPGPLDDAEWSIMREHPVWGARALEAIPEFRQAARAVRHHHERWDGTGYPDGLAGEAIPIGARVIAVCDAYEAMTSHRPYRPALAEPLARERVVAGTGSHFDPAVTWALLDALAS